MVRNYENIRLSALYHNSSDLDKKIPEVLETNRRKWPF